MSSSVSSISKKIVAGTLSLVLAATATATGFGNTFNVSAEEEKTYKGVYDITYGQPITVINDLNDYEGYKYNINLTQSGTLTITARNLQKVTLYDANNVKIARIFGTSTVTLNPGSYILEVYALYTPSSGNGEIVADFVSSGEKFTDSGNTIATQNTVKIPSASGKSVSVKSFFAKDSADTSDSFKLVVPSRTGLAIELNASDNKKYDVEIYNSSKKRITYKNYVSKGSTNRTYAKLSKGTYYLRIIDKYNYGGDYSVKLVTYNPTKSHKLTVSTSSIKNKSVSNYSAYVFPKSNYSDDKFTYCSSNRKVITVNSNGYVRFIGPGKAYLTVTAGSSEKYDKVSKKIPVYVKPAQPSGFSVRKTGSSSTGVSGKITWNRDSKVSGYVVKYSTRKNGKYKTYTLKSNKKNSFMINNLKFGSVAYVKVCSYKKVGKKTLYSSYYSYPVRAIRTYY